MKGDLAKAEQKWRKRPLFRKQQRALGLIVGSGILLILAGFGILIFASSVEFMGQFRLR
jgi:hypothetical protein